MSGKDKNARERTECSEICKTIRKKTREDIREHKTTRVKEAIENKKGLKKATNNKEGYKVMIPSMKEEDRSLTSNRERILDRCAELYEKLYNDAAQNIIRANAAEEVPPILDSEIEKAMMEMKEKNAPGEDQIMIEMYSRRR